MAIVSSSPIFTLDDATLSLIASGFDTMIDVLGKPCKLVLDGDRLPCPNCVFDSAAERSSGLYNGTGPRAFASPPCPVCKGTGYDPATAERVEVRTFSIKRNVRPSAVYPPGTLQRPATLARIKGYATDLPLVLQARHVVLDFANAKYLNERYVKVSEPTLEGQIVDSRYFTCYLRRDE
jgi:hypothetical protein